MKTQANSKPKPASESDEKEGLLIEYKALRDEILTAKERRLQTMSLAIGAVGVVLSILASFTLGTGATTPEIQISVAIGGSVVLYGIIIPALIMTITLQQTIRGIGEYIRIFIEPKVLGLNWENRWHMHKKQYRLPRGLQAIGSIYYFLSILPLLLPVYIISQNMHYWYLLFALAPFAIWSLYLSFDTHAAVSRGWKDRWEIDNQTENKKTKAG